MNRTAQSEALRFKMKAKNHNLPKEKIEQIPENEMPGMRKEIPKEETQNKYGDASRKLKLAQLGNMVRLYEYHFQRFRKGSLIEGRFAYTVKNKQIAAGHKKTGAYLDGDRKLDAGCCVGGFQEFAESNASAPTVQLQSIMLCLAVIAFRKWGFRVMDVSRAFLGSEHLKGKLMFNYQKQGVEGDRVAWELLLKPHVWPKYSMQRLAYGNKKFSFWRMWGRCNFFG